MSFELILIVSNGLLLTFVWTLSNRVRILENSLLHHTSQVDRAVDLLKRLQTSMIIDSTRIEKINADAERWMNDKPNKTH